MEALKNKPDCSIGGNRPDLTPPKALNPKAPFAHKVARAFTRAVFMIIRAITKKRDTGLPVEAEVIFKMAAKGGDAKTISVERLRGLYRMLTIPFHMDAPTMESIEEYELGEGVKARVYHPKGLPDAAPALLYFHGGGCVIGDLDTHDTLCRKIAQDAGVGVVSVAYRLAPEHRFPAQVIDTRNVCLWMCSNSEKLGFDPERTGIAGDSAGAYLAILLGLSRIGMSPSPKYLALIYPFLDPSMNSASAHQFLDGLLLTRPVMERFIGYMDSGDIDLKSPAITPLQHPDIGNLPPTLVVTVEFDPLRDEGRDLVQRIKARGGDITHIHEKRLYHEFISMGGVVPEAKGAIDSIILWIKSRAHS